MIGNDVVDLDLALKESNWKRKGFLTKVFTDFEQNLIQKATNKDEMVWTLWSLKESVYKASQRIFYVQGFFPKKIAVVALNKNKDSVTFYDNKKFYGKTSIERNCLHSFVVIKKEDFNFILNLESKTYEKDGNGLPFEKESKIPLSVSHHGQYLKIIGLSNH
ncbi:4'-phosphopantetheinyl transferase superfamily protein [Flavobacterium cucumis]|uniref:Phosphopantetheine--protein transferase domain-containing protein n=1 Tax=Flavobacterium cucumis TaxID=416016 RepID=A0A1M7ZZ13_9FLAO|nr:4'-phosphopantetheinyl transferase superfamily protein [Flavobacterium cucumis]SHO74112.1 phosphopantetheine--protein transferase domain-containing protein [Flavobacterium cucumis]